jgi:hypothetical protein
VQIRKVLTPTRNFFETLWRGFVRWWDKAWWAKAITILIATITILLLSLYGIARWYVASNASKPLELGVTFIPDYARSLDLDAEQTMDAIIDDLGVKHFRLVSYWNKHETEQGKYDFSDLDWQFEKAEKAHAKISLALGLRQPRWPECHIPDWAAKEPSQDRQAALEKYIGVVIDRYKNSPSLESYQLENEALLKNFGECPETNRGWLDSEAKIVKKHDDKHPLIMSRSNNYPSLSLGKPQPDLIGVSVYRRVWNENIYKGYYNYPLPSWYYAGIAGLQKIVTGKDSVLHEMQMEPWPPSGKFVKDVPLNEQDKSMSAAMFNNRVNFAKNTGMRTIDLWGAEWWYWRLEKAHDPSVWNEAKKVFENN